VVSTATFGEGKGGDLRIDAQDVQIIGTSADSEVFSGLFASAYSNSTGDAGDLTIKTNTLLVRDGAQVEAVTYSEGNAGNLIVDAQDVQLIGATADVADSLVYSGLFTSAQLGATGKPGDLTIKTNTLLVRDGAQVSANTFSEGKGGDLRIDAQDVQLIGRSAYLPSGLFSATGNSTGDAGDIRIKTNTLLVRDGAQVVTATFGTGNGGSLRVDAQDVQLIGITDDGVYSSALVTGSLNSGNAGDLTIKTNTLLVQDRALVTVESRGTGTAGNLTLNARSIRLDNNGSLRANTRSAKVDPNREQATININSQDLIITGNSNIRTNARGGNVFGGNININADVLVGIDNSDITANSADFRGGNVRINTQGIIGIQFRDIASLQTSDITATGATRELIGNVQITTPDVDPTTGLVELPADFVDRSDAIAQGCRGVQGSSFVVTGRGGLPPTPQQALGDDPRWRDWRTPAVVSRQPNTPGTGTLAPSANPASTKSAVVEATGWATLPDGKVILTASAPNVISLNRWGQPVNCDGS
jgi:large exoprotein involved in heme utilization and adhesion